MQYLMNTYMPLSLKLTRGDGCWLWDQEGNRYLDASSGLGVNILGYGHKTFIPAMQNQIEKLIHLSNMYEIESQQQLAEQLCKKTKMDKAFFCVSGAEAIECALKLARMYGHQRKIQNPTLIVTEGAYHGRTLATLTASGQRLVQAGFEPLMPGFVRVPFNDIAAVQQIAETRQDIVGVLLEPIQGSGGIRLASVDFQQKLRAVCDQNEWLYIADEIQTGLGRTGEFLASHQADVYPDIIALAKGLGNGIPIGTCLANQKASGLFTHGKHGSTFGGSPLGTTAGLTVLDIIEKEALLENVKTQGAYLMKALREQFQNNNQVQEIRGQGLMIGIELKTPPSELPRKAAELGILINITDKKVIRLLPPMIINQQECTILAEKLYKLVKNIH